MSGECEWRDVEAGYRCERPALLARIAAVEAENERLRLAQFEPLGDNHHNAAACPYCTPAAVLAASPTPTGPEPAKAKPIGYLNADPLRSLSAEERQGFTECPGRMCEYQSDNHCETVGGCLRKRVGPATGPATPEPTEENP